MSTDWNIGKPPPKVRPPNYAVVVVAFGERLFGPQWAAGVARLTGVNKRTLSRIYAAAKDERDYPAARGVLAALEASLAPILADLGPWAKHASD
jgi:hypothetical protein